MSLTKVSTSMIDGIMTSVKDFGAVGDGVTDDTAAIQAAFDSQQPIYMPVGVYKTTSELVIKNGTRVYGAGNWSAVQQTDMETGTTVIRYAGVGGANSCIVRMSKAAVGVDPNTLAAGARTILNASFCNITLDGQDLVEFGLYMARAWSNNQLDYITVTGTTRFAFWAARCFNGSPTNWTAYKNIGAGISLGENVFGWSSATVDQSVCTSFFGYFSGVNQALVYQNAFNETTGKNKEYGVGVFGSRAILMLNTQAAACGGAGTYVSTVLFPATFSTGYNEGNGVSSGSTASWDIWVEGEAGGVSRDITFAEYHLGLTPSIRLSGTAPSREESGVLFTRMGLLGTIDADWGNYRLIDCSRNVVFANKLPNGFVARNNTGLNMNISGVAVFDASAGSINTLMKEGIIDTITYDSTGTYDITLTETFSSARYAISVTTGDNRSISPTLIGNSGFTLKNRDLAGTLTDVNARVSVMVTGYYV
jgi:hypothetical protein